MRRRHSKLTGGRTFPQAGVARQGAKSGQMSTDLPCDVLEPGANKVHGH
jgi:hypothetical protein